MRWVEGRGGGPGWGDGGRGVAGPGVWGSTVARTPPPTLRPTTHVGVVRHVQEVGETVTVHDGEAVGVVEGVPAWELGGGEGAARVAVSGGRRGGGRGMARAVLMQPTQAGELTCWGRTSRTPASRRRGRLHGGGREGSGWRDGGRTGRDEPSMGGCFRARECALIKRRNRGAGAPLRRPPGGRSRARVRHAPSLKPRSDSEYVLPSHAFRFLTSMPSMTEMISCWSTLGPYRFHERQPRGGCERGG